MKILLFSDRNRDRLHMIVELIDADNPGEGSSYIGPIEPRQYLDMPIR